ncbi:FHA domain-containing protein [Candidatus Uabimicrobium sp. HlEnr_7]|uniref:FHA domain-containing protein n=1 Tax=Candidatus Uabimicrobium helgolandensis TaxID=3095367 RepID=UPI003555F88E
MAKLDIISGNDQNKSYEVKPKTVIGRLANNTIAINDTKSSRQNSLVFVKEGLYYIRDLKSRNGTVVNGEKLQKTQQLLSGDRIKIGNTVFVFSEEDDPDVTKDLASVKSSLASSPPKKISKAVSHKEIEPRRSSESVLQKGIREASAAVKKKPAHKEVPKTISINKKLESLDRSSVIVIIIVFTCILFMVARWLTLNLIS